MTSSVLGSAHQAALPAPSDPVQDLSDDEWPTCAPAAGFVFQPSSLLPT